MADSEAAAHVPVTVLIVEDDRVVADIYRLYLTRSGYVVHIANDGQDGLRAVGEHRPDFIFLDVRMPKMDGVEVLRRLAADEETKGIPVVMLTNYDDPALVTSTLALGAKEHLVKVKTMPNELPGVIEHWLNPTS